MTKTKATIEWTTDRVSLLRFRWLDGVSPEDIATAIGYPGMAGAVRAKAARQGLPSRAVPNHSSRLTRMEPRIVDVDFLRRIQPWEKELPNYAEPRSLQYATPTPYGARAGKDQRLQPGDTSREPADEPEPEA